MIKFALHGIETGFDISKALPVGELSEGHAQKLIPTGETLDFVVSTISLHTFSELVGRNKIHDL